MGIFLKNVFKKYTADAHQSVSPEETVRWALTALKIFPQELGVFENLEEVGHLDSMGLPVYKVNCKRRNNEWGKGLSEAQCQASAIMERVERFSSAVENWKNPPIIKNKKFSEIKNEAISYWDFVPCNLNRALWSKEKINELPMDWVRVFSLKDEKEKLVPAQFTFLHYRQKNYFDYGCSSGLAAGNTLEEAILQALCEIIERHSSHVALLNAVDLETIDLETVQNEELKKTIKKLEKKGFKIIASSFSGEWNIPSVSVFVFNPREKIVFKGGAYRCCATATDPEIALIRAITEVAQNRAVQVKRENFRIGEGFFVSASPEVVGEYHWRTQSVKKISIQELPNISRENFKEEIELAVSEIVKKGYDVLIFDLTHPIIQIPVVRVIIPGVQPNFLLVGQGSFNKKSCVSRHLKIYDQVVEACKKRIFDDQRIDN